MTYILLILGLGLLYFIRRSKFNRRNFAGIETFKNYEHAVTNKLLNTVLKIFAYLLIICGVGNYLMNKKNETKIQKEINNAPAKKVAIK